MREFINKTMVTGVLVKSTLEEKSTDKGEYIGGELIIRTADNNEHEVKIFSYKYKKDANGGFTNEVSKLYTGYKTIIDDYKSLETNPDDPDVISINNGRFDVNDYKNQKGEISTYNQISTRFVNRVETKDLETTIQEAKFEVEGVIDSIKDEIIKDVPTGNMIIALNVISQTTEGKGKDVKYTPVTMFPIKLTVPQPIVSAFNSAGYYDGAFVKFNGKLINTTDTTTTVEKQAFGEDLVKTFTNVIKKFEVVSGGNPQTIYEVDLTDDIYNQLKAKRSAKLAEIKAGVSSTPQTPSTPPPATMANPFAKKQ